MDDEIFEDEEGIFDDDEIVDCSILDELSEENYRPKGSGPKGSGCLTSILFIPLPFLFLIGFIMMIT